MSDLPAGPRLPHPLQTLAWLTRPVPWLLRAQERYGDVFTIQVARFEGPWVILAHPDAVKEVFTGPPDLLRAGEGNEILGPVLGQQSVLLLDGPQHLRQRRLLLPQFHGERMQRYESLVRGLAEEEVAAWPSRTGFPLAPRMQALTLEVILRAVFGLREGARLDSLRVALRELLEFVVDPRAFLAVSVLGETALKHPGFRRVISTTDELLLAEIAERRGVADLEDRDDVLSLLLQARHEDGAPMSDSELRDELLTLLVAGHETTATALSWALERLVRHPGALQRLRDGDPAYLEATCQETLRMRPILPLVLRRLVEPMTIAGHPLPAGVKVAPCIALVHHRPDIYPDPHAFRPERFLERPPGTYTWFPFGGGIRRCLGAAFALLEMRIVLDTVVRHTALSAAAPARERTRRRAITLAPEHGAEVVAA